MAEDEIQIVCLACGHQVLCALSVSDILGTHTIPASNVASRQLVLGRVIEFEQLLGEPGTAHLVFTSKLTACPSPEDGDAGVMPGQIFRNRREVPKAGDVDGFRTRCVAQKLTTRRRDKDDRSINGLQERDLMGAVGCFCLFARMLTGGRDSSASKNAPD